MKKHKLKALLKRLVLTEHVSCTMGGRWICVHVQNDKRIEPILACRDLHGYPVILDGNQLACCCLRHERTVDVWLIDKSSDADTILTLEAEGQIRQFAYRDFLTGAIGLEQLRKEAEKVSQELGRITVGAAVAGF